MLTWKASVQDSCEFLGERVKGEELDTPELDRTGVQSNLLKEVNKFQVLVNWKKLVVY